MSKKPLPIVSAQVVDEDHVHIGGSMFSRERTCELIPFADMSGEWDHGDVDITVCECTECGGFVLCPPEYIWADLRNVWPRVDHCPYCKAKVVSE